MPEEQWPRGVTPCPRSGAEAESPRLRRRRNGLEELPRVRGQWGVAQRRYPASEARGGDERSYSASEVRGGNERSYPASEVRGGGREEISHAPSPRPGAAARTTNPMSKEPWLHGRRRA